MSSKEAIGRLSTLSITSPAAKPACAAGLPATTSSTRGQDEDRGDEIGDRPGGDDRRARQHRLARQRLATLGRGHPRQRLAVGGARRVAIAGETNVAADRNRRQPPARAAAVGAADDLGTHADRENFDFDAAAPRHEEMAEFVDEHHGAEHEQERDDQRRRSP
jgi:hypothetical protein